MYTNLRWINDPKTYADILNNINYTMAREVHHNATLLGTHFTPHASNELWESFIYDICESRVPELETEILDRFNEPIVLGFVGRSGATLLPLTYCYPRAENYGEWAELREDYAGLSDLKGAAQIARARKVLKVLDYLNTRLAEMIRELPNAWDQFIFDNDPMNQLVAP